jgi:predicted  nucleic acid-binding Zn-ribbon protein
MRQSARVLSTDALRDFHNSLAKFSAKGREALRVALMDVRHTLDWLETQLKTWSHEVDKRSEEVNRCRAELAVVRSAPENWRSAVTDREIDLRRAQARLREAEEKVTAVKRWRRMLPQELNQYELPMRRLGGFLDGDARYALALLDAKIQALEEYIALAAPEAPVADANRPAPPPETTA